MLNSCSGCANQIHLEAVVLFVFLSQVTVIRTEPSSAASYAKTHPAPCCSRAASPQPHLCFPSRSWKSAHILEQTKNQFCLVPCFFKAKLGGFWIPAADRGVAQQRPFSTGQMECCAIGAELHSDQRSTSRLLLDCTQPNGLQPSEGAELRSLRTQCYVQAGRHSVELTHQIRHF